MPKSGEERQPRQPEPLRSAGRAVWTREICLPETGRHLPVLILCSKRQRLHRDPVSPGHLFSARKLPAGSMLIKKDLPANESAEGEKKLRQCFKRNRQKMLGGL